MSSGDSGAGSGRRILVFGLACFCVLGSAACAPSVVFLGDGALRAIVERADFENALEDAARSSGHRVQVIWDPSPDLGTAWLEQQLGEAAAPIVALSPYFSVFAAEFAARYTNTRFIAFGSGDGSDAAVTWVEFDRVPAFERLGRELADWIASGPERRIAVLFLTSFQSQRDELSALVGSFDEETRSQLIIREFNGVPDRDTVRRAVREVLLDGGNGFSIHLGSASRYALELVQSEPVVFGTDGARAAPSLADSVLYSIDNPLDAGLRAALEAPRAELIVVEATVETGRGYDDPELGATSPQASADDD